MLGLNYRKSNVAQNVVSVRIGQKEIYVVVTVPFSGSPKDWN